MSSLFSVFLTPFRLLIGVRVIFTELLIIGAWYISLPDFQRPFLGGGRRHFFFPRFRELSASPAPPRDGFSESGGFRFSSNRGLKAESAAKNVDRSEVTLEETLLHV